MALVTKLSRIRKESPKVHVATDCEVSIFVENGATYLQVDTFGSKARQDKGKISQSIQFNHEALMALRAFVDEALKTSVR